MWGKAISFAIIMTLLSATSFKPFAAGILVSQLAFAGAVSGSPAVITAPFSNVTEE